MNPISVTLEQLREHAPFEVRVTGAALTAFASEMTCVYFEWTYGEKADDEWRMHWSSYQSQDPLAVETPHGTVELAPNQLRLYLAPSYSRVFTRQAMNEAPPPVRAELAEADHPITVEEHCLQIETEYYARVETEAYFLPPEPGEAEPSRHYNVVLGLSDLPFVDGRPQRPLTPAYHGLTY